MDLSVRHGLQMLPGLHVGLKRQVAGYSFTTEHYDSFQVICITRGRVVMDTGGKERVLSPGRFMLLRREGAFRLSCGDGMDYEGVFMLTEAWTAEQACGKALALVSPPEMLGLITTLEKELRAPFPGNQMLTLSLGMSVVQMALRVAALQGAGEPQEEMARLWAERVRQIIENAIFSVTPIRELLSGCELGYRQLSRYFQAQYGVSPKRYQLLCRIEYARRLLTSTTLSVTSIALELGFPSSQHFAAQFARFTGMSPTAYRAAPDE